MILARKNFKTFVSVTSPDYEFQWFHNKLSKLLQDFAENPEFNKLMIFMPPQHGKSELASRRFPAFMLGTNPSLKIACVSYSQTLASKFNRHVKRIIQTPEYKGIFPETRVSNKRTVSEETWVNNANEFEIINKKGSYTAVGIGGALTGQKVDLLIIDDPVKGMVEAESPTIQARNFDWFNSVAETRLHNKSKILIIQTRWSEMDLSGLLLKHGREEWKVFKLPGIKENNPTEEDPREPGMALWEERFSKEKILNIKKRSPKVFTALYQQNPQAPEELLIMSFAKETSEAAIKNKIESGLPIIAGLDFGFSNSEQALIDCVIDINKKEIFCYEIIYETGLTNDKFLNKLRKKDYDLNRLCFADSAEPKSIQDLKDKGMNCTGVKKFANSVNTMLLFLEEFKVYYFGQNLKFEAENWKRKADPEGKPTPYEIDKYNHAWKAVLYCVWGFCKQGQEKPTTGLKIERRSKKHVR